MNPKNKVSQSLLTKLGSKSSAVRNKAALEIMELKPKGAKEALLSAALNPKNIGYSGTLVYALEAFDCSKEFGTLFDLALLGTYEVKCMAIGILESKRIKPTIHDIEVAAFKLTTIRSPEFRIQDKASLIALLEKIIRAKKKGRGASSKARHVAV